MVNLGLADGVAACLLLLSLAFRLPRALFPAFKSVMEAPGEAP